MTDTAVVFPIILLPRQKCAYQGVSNRQVVRCLCGRYTHGKKWSRRFYVKTHGNWLPGSLPQIVHDTTVVLEWKMSSLC